MQTFETAIIERYRRREPLRIKILRIRFAQVERSSYFFEMPFSEGDDKSAHLLSASWAFGDVGQRCAEVMASARTVPDLICETDEARLWSAKLASPISIAGMVCAAPRKGA